MKPSILLALQDIGRAGKVAFVGFDYSAKNLLNRYAAERLDGIFTPNESSTAMFVLTRRAPAVRTRLAASD
jgi:hypothetical protein